MMKKGVMWQQLILWALLIIAVIIVIMIVTNTFNPLADQTYSLLSQANPE